MDFLAAAAQEEAIGDLAPLRRRCPHGKEALAAFANAYREYALTHPGRYTATQIRLDQSLVSDSPAMRRTAEVTYGLLRAYGLGVNRGGFHLRMPHPLRYHIQRHVF